MIALRPDILRSFFNSTIRFRAATAHRTSPVRGCVLITLGRLHCGNRMADRLNFVGMTTVRRNHSFTPTWKPVGQGGHRRD